MRLKLNDAASTKHCLCSLCLCVQLYMEHVYIGFGLVLVQHENGEKTKIFSVSTFQGLPNTQMAIRWISCKHKKGFNTFLSVQKRVPLEIKEIRWKRNVTHRYELFICIENSTSSHWSYRQLKIFHASWTHPSRKFHAMLCSVLFCSVRCCAVLCIWITHSAHSCLCRIGQALRWA